MYLDYRYIQCKFRTEINGDLGHDSSLEGFTEMGTTSTNEMDFGMNRVPGAGSINLDY